MGFFYDAATREAHFDKERTFRFTLTVTWSANPVLNFIGCNPSTADERKNDPTIERLQRRAAALGFGGLIVTNLFAFKSPYPKELIRAARAGVNVVGIDSEGRKNDEWIEQCAHKASKILCGWGTHGAFLGRGSAVQFLLRKLCASKLFYLKLCGNGQPQHPLYLPYDLALTQWS